MPADLVRALLNGIEKNVGREFAEVHELEVLKEPTHTPGGRPRPSTRAGGRPVKPKTTVDQAAAKKTTSPAQGEAKKAVTPADNQKEKGQ